MARFLGWSMSVDPNNPLEITVDLSISDNDFVIVSDIEPVPDLSFFSEIKVFSDHLTCYVEPKSDNSHKFLKPDNVPLTFIFSHRKHKRN